jgi:hypothetical protein
VKACTEYDEFLALSVRPSVSILFRIAPTATKDTHRCIGHSGRSGQGGHAGIQMTDKQTAERETLWISAHERFPSVQSCAGISAFLLRNQQKSDINCCTMPKRNTR